MKSISLALALVACSTVLSAQVPAPPAPPAPPATAGEKNPQDEAVALPAATDAGKAKVEALRKALAELLPVGKASEKAITKARRTLKAKAGLPVVKLLKNEFANLPAPPAEVTEDAAAAKLGQFLDRLVETLAVGEGALVPAEEAASAAGGVEKTILRRVADQIYVQIAVDEINSYIENNRFSGTFDGMFPKSGRFGRKSAQAFLQIFAEGDFPANVKALAGEGVAQHGSKDDLKAVRDVRDDDLEEQSLRDRAAEIVARLGDRTEFNKKLATIDTQIDAATGKLTGVDKTTRELLAKADELKKNATRTPELEEELKKLQKSLEETGQQGAQARFDLGRLHQDKALLFQAIRDHAACEKSFKAALDAWGPMMNAYFGNAAFRSSLSNVFYNLACSQSLQKKVDDAYASMELAFKCGYQDFAWAMRDGDLANLRAVEKFPALVEEVRSGKARDRWKKEMEEQQKAAGSGAGESEKKPGDAKPGEGGKQGGAEPTKPAGTPAPAGSAKPAGEPKGEGARSAA